MGSCLEAGLQWCYKTIGSAFDDAKISGGTVRTLTPASWEATSTASRCRSELVPGLGCLWHKH